MKQVFDWMRNKTRAELEHAENEVRTGKGILIKEPFTPYKKFISIINEAEAKWNEDVCEWKKEIYSDFSNSSCGVRALTSRSWRFCPYCGKKKKVVE